MKSKTKGVTRIDQPSNRTHGWFVRVGYYQPKKGTYRPRHVKFFGDAGHGGKRKALAAAEAFATASQRKVKRAA